MEVASGDSREGVGPHSHPSSATTQASTRSCPRIGMDVDLVDPAARGGADLFDAEQVSVKRQRQVMIEGGISTRQKVRDESQINRPA